MAEFNFDDIESDGEHVHTVLMKDGEQEREIPFDQINTTNIGLVFSLNPSTVWVQDGYGSRIFIPNERGIFQLPRRLFRAKVNGVPLVQEQMRGPGTSSAAGGPTMTATPGPSNRPIFHSVASRSGSKSKIKIVLADMSYARNGKPDFSAHDAMFVDVTPGNANLQSILTVVQEEFGDTFTIVSNDGFEIKDSSATRDLKFWKTPSRKLFAVPKEQIKGKKAPSGPGRRSPENEQSRFDKSVEGIHGKIQELEMKIWAKQGNVPLHFKEMLEESLKCKICHASPIKPPVILAKCCNNILGCQVCANQWFSGPDALTKSCPICGMERGYANSARLHGLDELMEEVETSQLLKLPS